MQQSDHRSRAFGLDDGRAFVEAAEWHFARTMPENPHWYVVRFECRRKGLEEGYVGLVELIRSPAGYDRRWHTRTFRSLDLDGFYYWPMTDAPVWGGQPITEETSIIINRAKLVPGEGRQLSLGVGR